MQSTCARTKQTMLFAAF